MAPLGRGRRQPTLCAQRNPGCGGQQVATELPSRAGAAHPSQRQSLGLTCAPRVRGGSPVPQPGWSSRDALPRRTDLGSDPRSRDRDRDAKESPRPERGTLGWGGCRTGSGSPTSEAEVREGLLGIRASQKRRLPGFGLTRDTTRPSGLSPLGARAHRASPCASACEAGPCRPTRSRCGPRCCPWWGWERGSELPAAAQGSAPRHLSSCAARGPVQGSGAGPGWGRGLGRGLERLGQQEGRGLRAGRRRVPGPLGASAPSGWKMGC